MLSIAWIKKKVDADNCGIFGGPLKMRVRNDASFPPGDASSSSSSFPVRTHHRQQLLIRLQKKKKTLSLQFRTGRAAPASPAGFPRSPCDPFLRSGPQRWDQQVWKLCKRPPAELALWWFITVRLEVISLNVNTVVAFYCVLYCPRWEGRDLHPNMRKCTGKILT